MDLGLHPRHAYSPAASQTSQQGPRLAVQHTTQTTAQHQTKNPTHTHSHGYSHHDRRLVQSRQRAGHKRAPGATDIGHACRNSGMRQRISFCGGITALTVAAQTSITIQARTTAQGAQTGTMGTQTGTPPARVCAGCVCSTREGSCRLLAACGWLRMGGQTAACSKDQPMAAASCCTVGMGCSVRWSAPVGFQERAALGV